VPRLPAFPRLPHALALICVLAFAGASARAQVADSSGHAADSVATPAWGRAAVGSSAPSAWGGTVFDTLVFFPSDTVRLSRQFIEPLSLRAFLLPTPAGSAPPLSVERADLLLDTRQGVLLLSPALRARLDSTARCTLIVSYRALPFRFAPVYRHRTLVTRQDTARGDSLRVAVPSAPLTLESIFGPDLQKSGYIGRGINVGTDRDLTITSGFRLQISGKLSDDITVTGALTDENTPIQPEGTTRTLQELDKVFIRIEGGPLAATLGDFSLAYTGTEFGRYARKLSGVMGEGTTPGDWNVTGAASAAYASLKGSYRSLQFNGNDGVQGPYRLTGRNGEQPILVLAGTERVYVDGMPMTRGETNDYVIEYGSGELTFMPRRLISSYSRITVDYEYADRQFVRTMVASSADAAVDGERYRVRARFVREADDPDAPIDQALTPADRAVLSAAGNDQSKAVRDGVLYVGFDTARGTGAGQYMRVDTTINGAPAAIYRYAPGTDSATYVLQFSFVGTGGGDYRRVTVGTFQYAGPGAGDYLPVRLLPMPRLQQITDVALAASPVRSLSIGAEAAVSTSDANRLSDKGDGGNTDGAFNVTAAWSPSTPIGDASVSARLRRQNANFTPIDRIDDIEFRRKWDLTQSAQTGETMREAALTLRPATSLQLHAGGGTIDRGTFSSTRVEAGVALTDAAKDTTLPEGTYIIENITSDDGGTGAHGSWLRQQGSAVYRWSVLQPRLHFEQEHKESTNTGDSLLAGSLGVLDVRPGLTFGGLAFATLNMDVGVRRESAPLAGRLEHQFSDLLQQYGVDARPGRDLAGTIELLIRDRRYAEPFRQLGMKDFQTILTRATTRYVPLQSAVALDLLYQVSTERTSKLQRVYLPVPLGQGNYNYLGDLNGNGVPDENEFELTRFDGNFILTTLPTDALYPVIDLQSSLRLRLQPWRASALWHGASTMRGVLEALSAETILRVDEKSSDPVTSNVYLLRLDTFLDDSTTIRGFQTVRQDLFLFERSAEFSLRGRFEEARGYSAFALARERAYKAERSLRAKSQLVREIGLQADLAFGTDNLSSSAESTRAREITSTTAGADFSYRPWQHVEVGLVASNRSATDTHIPQQSIDATVTTITLRSILSFDGPGRLRADIERNDTRVKGAVDRMPYELTDGRPAGRSWVLRISADYRLTSFLQATLSYLGRSEEHRPVVHNGRAEVKAFF
jgi:hypothetical protein